MALNIQPSDPSQLARTLREYEERLRNAGPQNPTLRLKAREIGKRVAENIINGDDTWKAILMGDDYWTDEASVISQLGLAIETGLNAIVSGEI